MSSYRIHQNGISMVNEKGDRAHVIDNGPKGFKLITTQGYRRMTQRLEAYVRGFQEKAELEGRGTELPTFREVARRFKLRYAEIESMIHDSEVLDHIVGFKTAGGWAEFSRLGENKIEYMGE